MKTITFEIGEDQNILLKLALDTMGVRFNMDKLTDEICYEIWRVWLDHQFYSAFINRDELEELITQGGDLTIFLEEQGVY
jgi:hypothetical protein